MKGIKSSRGLSSRFILKDSCNDFRCQSKGNAKRLVLLRHCHGTYPITRNLPKEKQNQGTVVCCKEYEGDVHLLWIFQQLQQEFAHLWNHHACHGAAAIQKSSASSSCPHSYCHPPAAAFFPILGQQCCPQLVQAHWPPADSICCGYACSLVHRTNLPLAAPVQIHTISLIKIERIGYKA